MRASIGQPGHGLRMREHLADDIEISIVVVRAHRHRESSSIVLDQIVIQNLIDRLAFALCPRTQRHVGCRLIVVSVGHHEESRRADQECGRQRLHRARILHFDIGIRENPSLHLWIAHSLRALADRQSRQLIDVDPSIHEAVIAGEARQEPHLSRRDLRPEKSATGVLFARESKDVSPLLGMLLRLHRRERHGQTTRT